MRFIFLLLISLNVFAGQKINGTLEVTGETTLSGETASSAVILDGSKKLKSSSTVSSTELGYLDGVTSAIQTQIDGKEPTITTLSVAKGGTGATTLTANNVILGNGSSAVQFVAPGASGNVLTSNGTTWTSTAGTSSNPVTAPGTTNLKTCRYAFGGASASLASPTECTSGTCVEVADSCGAGTPPSRSSAGVYADMTFANGTWANSVFLDCQCEAFSATTNQGRRCNRFYISPDQTWSTNSSGGAVLNLYSTDAATTATDSYYVITCWAAAP